MCEENSNVVRSGKQNFLNHINDLTILI